MYLVQLPISGDYINLEKIVQVKHGDQVIQVITEERKVLVSGITDVEYLKAALAAHRVFPVANIQSKGEQHDRKV